MLHCLSRSQRSLAAERRPCIPLFVNGIGTIKKRKAEFVSYVIEVIYVGVLFDKTAQYKSKLFWCSENPQCLFYFDEFKFANVVSRAWKRRQDRE